MWWSGAGSYLQWKIFRKRAKRTALKADSHKTTEIILAHAVAGEGGEGLFIYAIEFIRWR